MGAIKKKLNILWAVAVVTYKEWSAYRTHSMVSILVGPIYFIVQYFIWTAAYGGKTADEELQDNAGGQISYGIS